MQIKSYVNDNDIRNQVELLTLDTFSPTWARKLEESKLVPTLSLRRLRLYLELKDSSKCVVGEAHGFSSSYESSCKRCFKLAGSLCFIL
jgi:hypothetical protein